MKTNFLYILFITAILAAGCNSNSENTAAAVSDDNTDEVNVKQLFKLLDSGHTGIDFTNDINEDADNNFANYDYMYNGSGVAIGDIDNDGLMDIYFTGNMVSNKLYLNKGEMKFKDITDDAGVDGGGGWCNGVTFIDINEDGWLDIYVCRSYYINDRELRKNLLYINNQDLTFTESAAEYGLDYDGFSIQTVFFDFDKDGDLDIYMTNHPIGFKLDVSGRKMEEKMPGQQFSDKLFRNDGDKTYTDVTKKAGIQNYGYGLGLVVGDVNGDDWPDIYVANDYIEPDCFYINNGDGTFTNQINNYVKHISNFGMGIDLADINNDGLLDILVLDMMAEDNYRQKTNMSAMDAERFWYLVDNGYHYQYMRNTLQLNNGNGTFSEIGQFAGINNTDWSWSALMADYDNDGFKDIFITNGYRRDSKNVDATAIIDKMIADNNGVMPKESFIEMLDILPSVKLSNYFFRNNGDLTFSNLTGPVGLDEPSFSNGAAHGDLDNDGDLDIVVNNILDKAFVFENIINDYEGGNYLRIKLIGISPNISGAGTRITLVAENDEIQFQEFSVTKGFQSCVEHYVHFGVGDAEKIKEIRILWPDDRMQIFSDVDVNQVLQANQIDANEDWDDSSIPNKTLFTEITSQTGIDFTHEENTYDDYVKESLLPHKMSQFGPCIATGDVNGDGLEDFYVGGAAGQAGRLYINNGSSSFSHAAIQPFENEKKCEDIGSLFFDADGDGDLDLYVVSGGNEFEVSSDLLQDRLYLNDNAGNFSLSADALPEMLTSGSCVVASDYDNDGDLDLFVGGRVVPGKYAFPVFSYILNNDNGKFSNVTENVAPDLIKPGMVTSAVWTDFDNDGDDDLIVVGEWMPISLYENDNGKFKDVTFDKGMETTTGWWNKIVSADFDGDGDMDYMLGNLGLNYKYKATVEEPLHLYCHDFDNSGTIDIVLGYYNHGECFPVRGRECTSGQIPMIKEKFKNYDSYGSATLEDVYGDLLQSSLQHHTAQMFESIYMQNNGDGSFELIALPVQAQFSTVFGIIPEDFDNDGHLDVVLAGNFYVSEVETGRADAGIGLFMRGDGKGNFEPKTVSESGFFTPLDVRNLEMLVDDNGDRIILVGNNDDAMQIIKVNGTKQIN